MKRCSDSNTPLFDAMAQNLSEVRAGYRDEILCPSCMRKFARSDLRLLTRDHVLAKALGGKKQVLTCKICNNEAGHKIQGHLKTLYEINETFRGNGEFRGRLTIFGETIPVSIVAAPGSGLGFRALGGSPKSIKTIEEGIERRQPTAWKAEARMKYSSWKGSAAIARAAYLAAFDDFGYEYILADGPNLLRQEIISAMDTHSPRLCLLTGKGGSGLNSSGNEPESIIIPVDFDGFQFYLVMLRFQYNLDYWVFCALPDEKQPPETLFTDLADAVQRISNSRLHMKGDESGTITVSLVPWATKQSEV